MVSYFSKSIGPMASGSASVEAERRNDWAQKIAFKLWSVYTPGYIQDASVRRILAEQDSAECIPYGMKFKIIVSFICFYFRQLNAFTRRPDRVILGSGTSDGLSLLVADYS